MEAGAAASTDPCGPQDPAITKLITECVMTACTIPEQLCESSKAKKDVSTAADET